MPVTNPLLKTRLDYLEAELKQEPPGFILTADLPFAIFRYDPSREDEGEWLMRREIQNLKVRVQNATGRTIHLISLADLYWRAIDQAEGIDAVVRLERSLGSIPNGTSCLSRGPPCWGRMPTRSRSYWSSYSAG